MNNSNNGGFPWMMGGPGQREIVRRSERDEIGADDARGRRVIILNIIIVCIIMMSIILLIGPFAVVAFVLAVIAIVTWWLVGLPWNKHEDVSNYDASIAWIIATFLSTTWLFVVDNWLWKSIITWYPIRWIAPLWIIIPVWIICGAALYGLRDLREAHRRSLYNRNWPPLFESMPSSFGPYFNDWHYPDEVVESPAQIIMRDYPRPIPAYFANPNINRLQEQLIDASERQHRLPPKPAELPEGAFKAPNGRIARIEDLAEFLIDGVTVGATYQTWHRRKNWSEPYWQALYGTCAQHGFAKPSRIKSRSRLLVKSKREAAQAIEHLRRYLFKDDGIIVN